MEMILDTPKILEIDVNRVLIAQNQISYIINQYLDFFLFIQIIFLRSSVQSNENEQKSIRSYLALNRSNGTIKNENNQSNFLTFQF